jgi:DNA-binding transcriptional regulator LsrR (DeoR family)
MARRLFDVIDIVEVLQHWYSGRSKTDVAESLGIDRGTIRKYVLPALNAGMVPGGVAVSLNRPEFDGGLKSTKGWSHARRKKVPGRVA